MSVPLFEKLVGRKSSWAKALESEFEHPQNFYEKLSNKIEDEYDCKGL